jgi:CDP-diacylglycerol pyrophosphatase
MKCFFSGQCAVTLAALSLDSRTVLGLMLKTCEMNFGLPRAFPYLKVFIGADPLSSYAVAREPLAYQRTIFSPLSDFTGVEDPRLLIPGAQNYFSVAWNDRKLVIPHEKDAPKWRQLTAFIRSHSTS